MDMNRAQINSKIALLKEKLHKKGVYKYIYDNEIIYIGRSHTSIFNRIEAHKQEDKFKPYLEKCQIYVYY